MTSRRPGGAGPPQRQQPAQQPAKLRLHQALGVDDPEPLGGLEPPPALVDAAVAFRLGGGVLGLADWAAQSPLERLAFAEAGRRLLALARGETPPAAGESRALDPGLADAQARRAARARGLGLLHEALRARSGDAARDAAALDAAALDARLALLGLSPLPGEVATGHLALADAVERFERRCANEAERVARDSRAAAAATQATQTASASAAVSAGPAARGSSRSG